MEMVEREYHRAIYGITAGQPSTFDVHLKEELLHTTIWNTKDWATTMVQLTAVLYRESKVQLTWFGQLFDDAQDRLELKLCPKASHGLTSRFAQEFEQEHHTIITAVLVYPR
jgi:hypothetical protein